MSQEITKLVHQTIKKEKQLIIFANTKRSAEKLAEDLSKTIKNISFSQLSKQILSESPTKQCQRLSKCVKKGIAFHHAGLTPKQKDIIETKFREGTLKAICATPTLAMGLSLPAFRVIIKNLKRYGGKWGMQWIPVLEFHQQIGRAGRPEFDDHGEAIVIARNKNHKKNIHQKYILGQPEDIYSKLAVEPVFRMYLLSLIATDFVKTKKQINNFFKKTFWAHQYKDEGKIRFMVDKVLNLLKDYLFIEFNEKDFKSAQDLEDTPIKTTPLGQRVAELYIDPYTANHIITCMKKSKRKKTTPFAFLQMIAHTLEMEPLLRTKTKEYDQVQEKLNQNFEELLDKEPTIYDPLYDEYLNSIKTAWAFEEWINEKNEEFLLENFDLRPGLLKAKINLADWLLYASQELARIIKEKDVIKELIKIRLRLKYGAKEELLPLLKIKGVGRKRSRDLFRNGLKNLKDLKNTDPSTLSQIVGPKTAVNIKKQLGQEVKKVPQNKRKGQINLKDF